MEFLILGAFLWGVFSAISNSDSAVKKRALKQLRQELEDLIHNNTKLIASAYRNSVSTNSFGKKITPGLKKILWSTY